jgi:hypothetical protein
VAEHPPWADAESSLVAVAIGAWRVAGAASPGAAPIRARVATRRVLASIGLAIAKVRRIVLCVSSADRSNRIILELPLTLEKRQLTA